MEITTDITCHTASILIEAVRLKGHTVDVSLFIQGILRQMGVPETDLYDMVWNEPYPFEALMKVVYGEPDAEVA
jgi:hypothetical protein